MVPSLASLPSSRRCLLAVLVVTLPFLFVVGCGGGDLYSVNEGRVAQRFLPTEQSVGHHPDSLRALTITEGEGKIQYQVEQDYQSLTEKWSSSFQSVGTGRRSRSRTYATFWSLELSLMSLQPEMGVLSLRKEKARELIDRRREKYFERIHIDVYWFVERRGESGIITGPGARTELHVRDSTYRPVRADHGPLREAFIGGGETILYRRNSLYFPRTVDGTDILVKASEAELEIRRTGASLKERFTWNWEDDSTARLLEVKPWEQTAGRLSHRP